MTYTNQNLSQVAAKGEIKGCLIYTRVSTDRQAEEGYSLNEQETTCRQHAQRLGYTVLGEFREEGVSGTSINRPKFQEMLFQCSENKNIQAIMVIHTDRFARNTLEHLQVKAILQKYSIRLISVNQPMIDSSPEGNLTDIILAGVNEFYARDLGRKVSKNLDEKAKEGWWPGQAPLGYLNVSDDQNKKKYVAVDNEKAPYVKEAFNKFKTNKYTLESLGEELNGEGFRSRNGKAIRKSLMSSLLRNIFYTGKFFYKGKLFQGKHEPIVDRDTFYEVQKLLDNHNNGANRKRKHKFLLGGSLFCCECTSQLTGERHIKKSGLVFDYYRCLGPKHKEKDCKQPFIPVNKIEKQLEVAFMNISLSSVYSNSLRLALNKVYQSQQIKDYSKLKSFENRKVAVETKMDKLEDLLLEKVMDRNRSVTKYTRLKEELNSIEQEIAKIKSPAIRLKKEDIEEIVNFVKNMGNIYLDFDPNKKKQFIRLLIDKILVKNRKLIQIKYTPMFQAIIDKDLVRIGSNWLLIRDLIRTIMAMRDTNSTSSNYLLDI